MNVRMILLKLGIGLMLELMLGSVRELRALTIKSLTLKLSWTLLIFECIYSLFKPFAHCFVV